MSKQRHKKYKIALSALILTCLQTFAGTGRVIIPVNSDATDLVVRVHHTTGAVEYLESDGTWLEAKNENESDENVLLNKIGYNSYHQPNYYPPVYVPPSYERPCGRPCYPYAPPIAVAPPAYFYNQPNPALQWSNHYYHEPYIQHHGVEYEYYRYRRW